MTFHKQQGKSMFPVLVIIGILVFFSFKAIPMYIVQTKIANVMDNLASQPEVGKQTKTGLTKIMLRRLSLEDVDMINSQNFKRYFKFQKISNGYDVMGKVTQDKKLFGDFYLTLKFEKTVELH